jgi:hypothetical protein
LPNTALKEATTELYKSPFEDFLIENYGQIRDGWIVKDCIDSASTALNTGTVSYKKKQIELELIKCCGNAKQMRSLGTPQNKKPYAYKLMDNYVDKFKPIHEHENSNLSRWKQMDKMERADLEDKVT